MKDLPKCLCGAHDWKEGGAIFGGMEQSGFSCQSCGRPGEFLYASGCGGFLLPTDVGGDIDAERKYINDVLLVIWRVQGEKAEEARSKLVASEWATFCQQHDLPVGTKYSDVPMEIEGEKSTFLREIGERPDYRIPAGFEKAPMPPKLPTALTIFLLIQGTSDSDRWEQVKHADTKQLEMPLDPIRVQHDEYHNLFFASLSEKLGVSIEREEIKNQYSGAINQPWFRFKLGEVIFVVGPRERVAAINIEAPNGISVAEIRAAAQGDDVTYSEQDQMGEYSPSAIVAHKITVHAWDTEQLERYLIILGQAALGTVNLASN